MKPSRLLIICSCLVLTLTTAIPRAETTTAPQEDWYFAVSGDSRDCGDIIMPKIARAIADRRPSTPVRFYWHLGDFRAMYRIDCDIVLRTEPAFPCASQNKAPTPGYLKTAWDDFIERQLKPFGKTTPVYVGIGNHELYGGMTRYQYREKFQHWLTQDPLDAQRQRDADAGFVYQPGNTFYHFAERGVDFIYLDNADDGGFSEEQLAWLETVLARDARDASIKTIIVGMHAALPHSASSGHAMDKTCPGVCSGTIAYDMLYKARTGTPQSKGKHVYILASHSHQYLPDIYKATAPGGKVIQGWIVGTAGAQQYTKTIKYGYLQIKVKPDGTVAEEFVEVTRVSEPLAAKEITDYCFDKNLTTSKDNEAKNCCCNTWRSSH